MALTNSTSGYSFLSFWGRGRGYVWEQVRGSLRDVEFLTLSGWMVEEKGVAFGFGSGGMGMDGGTALKSCLGNVAVSLVD